MPTTEFVKLAGLKYDGPLAIATGKSRYETQWKNRSLSWRELVERFSRTTRTQETVAEYRKLTLKEQGAVKDVGGFFGGSLKQGKRQNGYVANRTLLTLDIDNLQEPVDSLGKVVTLLHGFACAVYTTHSHTPEKPRLRLIIPLSRPVACDEYQAVTRKIAEQIGIDKFDDTTYEPTRFMYWPSTSQDGDFFFSYQDGEWLEPEDILNLYPDWRDISYWPESSRQKAKLIGQMGRQEDPETKGGVIGAFCRTYAIEDAIETFLGDVYLPAGQPDRYTYAKGSTVGGVRTYEGKWSYSHHGTDPASLTLCNAFDLIRIHKFGSRDDESKPDTPVNRLPSFIAMSDFAAGDAKVRELLSAERLEQAAKDFDLGAEVSEIDLSWTKKLDVNRKGEVQSTINNVLIILENDTFVNRSFAFNEFTNRAEVRGKLPWNDKFPRNWEDSDDAGVRHYVESAYGITGASKIADAVVLAMNKRKFHPVRAYLDGLKWDGLPRVDTLLIDYLGAEDSEYTRFVTRKWLCGAVARIYRPGIKFDYMLVLTGPQGLYKSTFFKFLAKDWFTDSIQDVDGNQAVEKLMGSWIVEFGELQAFNRSESHAIKRFITSQEDRTRLAYDRRNSYLPRQCVFAGTTNREDFLKDDTGNRRYWPVKVQKEGRTASVIKHLRNEIDQIWAEAIVLWRDKKESLYPSPEQEEIAIRERAAHREANEKEGLILQYLDTLLPENWESYDEPKRRMFIQGMDVVEGTILREKVCVLEIWCECFGRNRADLKRGDSLEITGILNNLEYNMGIWKANDRREYVKLYGQQRVFYRVKKSP